MSQDLLAGILDPDERILWQGRPDRRWVLELSNLISASFVLALLGMFGHAISQAEHIGGSPIHFAIFLVLGICVALWTLISDTWRRRRTWYTITNTRIIIASLDWRRARQLQNINIDPGFPMELKEADRDTLVVGRETHKDSEGDRVTHDLALERIEHGREVLRILREIQDHKKGDTA